MHLVVDATLEVEAGIGFELEIFQAVQQAMGNPRPEPLKVPLGGGFEGRVEFILGCTLSAEAEVGWQTQVDFAFTAEGGVEKQDERLVPISGLAHQFAAEARDLEVTGEAQLKCYLQPKLSVVWLNTVSIYAQAGPYASAVLDFGPRANSIEARVGIEAFAGVDVTLDLGLWNLNLFNREWPLYDRYWVPWRQEFTVCGDGFRGGDEECDPGTSREPAYGGPRDSCDQTTCECREGYAPQSDPTLQWHSSLGNWGTQDNFCEKLCGNYRLDPGEVCDMGANNGTCWGNCRADCSGPIFTPLNGVLEECEACDDGNDDPCDGCRSGEIYEPTCGDGRVDYVCLGETCDDGNDVDTDTCSNACRISRYCGDGVVSTAVSSVTGLPIEACDDGNDDPCDGCHFCRLVGPNTCGDGYACGGEECDRGPGGSSSCNPDCTASRCGDGIVNPLAGERCDDGGASATCDGMCRPIVCGDGVVSGAEECDTFGAGGPGCNADCTFSRCGDGVVNAADGEACDDGDQDNCTWECAATCRGPTVRPVCGDGVRQCGEACDQGSLNGAYAACAADCSGPGPICGNGVVEPAYGEVCDDGNTAGGDGCRPDCQGLEVCGDGHLDVGETCDDADPRSCRGTCNETCTALYASVCGDGTRSGCEVCEDTDPTNRTADVGCAGATPNCAGCGACSADVCGDGIVGPSEVCERVGRCEDGSEAVCTAGGGECAPGVRCGFTEFEGECNATCQRQVVCGDGFIDGFEVCDGGPSCNDSCTGPVR